MIIIFPKSQVFAYVYAVAAAKNASNYSEGYIGKRLHHVACFKSIEGSRITIFQIVRSLYHTKGIQIFINGSPADPYKVNDVLECYLPSTKVTNLASYCSVNVNSHGLPCSAASPGETTITLPCRLLSGRAYKRIENSSGTMDDIFEALAHDENVAWCPSFNNFGTPFKLLNDRGYDFDGELDTN